MATKKDTACAGCGVKISEHPERDFIKDSNKGLILCSECIEYYSKAQEQIDHAREKQEGQDPETLKLLPEQLPFPEDIYKMLSDHVVGQEEAKKTMAIAVAHHYRRLKNPSIGKSNILLIGPTGTGKTEMARVIAHYLKVPFVSVDATAFTSKGYVGEDADSSIQRLLSKCNYNVALAERGIVFIDEIDKIARRGTDGGSGISTVAVQQELLRLMEGDSVKITRPIEPGVQDVIYVNTSKILFICSGAFVGLDDIVKKGNSKTMGIGPVKEEKPTDLANELEAKHLTQYGMIPEFLGRLPVVATTEKLTEDQMLKILQEPKNSLTQQYQTLFKEDQVELEYSEEFLKSVVSEAFKKEIGARGLRQIIEKRMKPVFYRIHEFKNQKITMTESDFFATIPSIPISPLKKETKKEPKLKKQKVKGAL